MREGGYVRYDGRKSTQVLRDCDMLIADYGGRLSRLHDAALDAANLEERLLAFYGVGPVTMNIFLLSYGRSGPRPIPIRCRSSKDWRSASRSISTDTAKKAWCSRGSKPALFSQPNGGRSHQRTRLSASIPCFAGKYREIRRSQPEENHTAVFVVQIQWLISGFP